MRFFRFDTAVARLITDWDTRGVRVASLLHLDLDTDVNCLHYAPDTVLGRHPTGRQQLFAVVKGEGWVSGPDGLKRPISEGQAVLWDTGESHESGSAGGMTVIVVQATRLDPSASMPELD
jgi:quercetin dioxygenase-like cupin family protein